MLVPLAQLKLIRLLRGIFFNLKIYQMFYFATSDSECAALREMLLCAPPFGKSAGLAYLFGATADVHTHRLEWIRYKRLDFRVSGPGSLEFRYYIVLRNIK